MAKRLFVHNGKTYKCRRPNAVRISHEDTKLRQAAGLVDR